MHLLIVEDETKTATYLTQGLRENGFTVDVAMNGLDALHMALESHYELIVLDLMLPKIEGLDVARTVRRTSNVPIIMLTARSEELDRLIGLELGADDYVVKPFSPREIASRVKAVLRRTRSGSGVPERSLTFDDLTIEPTTRRVEVNGQECGLTAKEFDLLYFMARHPRQVFKRDQLLEHVWGFAEYVDPSTVTVHIRRLREKIEDDPGQPRRIQTVWGVGYKFEPDVNA